jgi:hypothetical protein
MVAHRREPVHDADVPRLTVAVAVVGATVALIVAGCRSGPEDTSTRYSTGGLTLAVPSGWSSTSFSTTNDPHRLAVASYPLPEAAVEGDCGGIEAVRQLPREGSLVLVIDYGDGPKFKPRPDNLELSSGEFANYDCFGASTAFRFRVAERDLQAHLAFGPDATDDTKEHALDVLRSIETSVSE